MRYIFLSVTLAALCTSAAAQAPNPFARPSAQPATAQAHPNTGHPPNQQHPVPPPPPNVGPGGLPELPNQNLPQYPIGPVPSGLPSEQIESVPVKRIGKVNGIAILRGEQTYMFEKEKSLGLVRKPQLGSANRNNGLGGLDPTLANGIAQPAPSANSAPVTAAIR